MAAGCLGYKTSSGTLTGTGRCRFACAVTRAPICVHRRASLPTP